MESPVTRLYRLRFEKELKTRNKIWQILCQDFFQKYVKPSDYICDLGAGFCEFINNIKAKKKFAVDVNPKTKKYAHKNIKVIISSSTQFTRKIKERVDIVFASNFFEHLSTKDELTLTVSEIKKILKKGGKLIILMPNIRHVGPAYWDFIDHQLPLTDRSMIELLQLNGFKLNELKSKFLPYSTKSRLPKSTIFVKLYLKFPLLYFIFGKQSLIIAQK